MNPAFDPRSLTLFLHDCFREDYRSQAVLDLNSSKVERKHVFEDPVDLLIQGSLSVPTTDTLEALAKVADLHQTEKTLSLGVIFAIGSMASDDGNRSLVCAPLITYPLTLTAAEDPSAGLTWSFDRDRPRINHSVLGRRAAELGVAQESIDRVFETWLSGEPNAESIRGLARSLAGLLPDLDPSPMDTFPPWVGRKQLQSLRSTARREMSDTLTLVPAMAAMLIRRSLETRGVLSELERMAAQEDAPSRPLLALFDQLKPLKFQSPGRSSNPDHLTVANLEVNAPALLSSAQQQVVKNAAHFPLSLVIGPPGTGKSFTIAAIALDALAHGDSVLITSRTHHAVDVIGDKLEGLLGQSDFVVRGGRKAYQKELKERVIEWLAGNLPGRPTSGPAVSKNLKQLKRLALEIEGMEAQLAARSELEQIWGHHVVEGPGKQTWLERISSRYQGWTSGRKLRDLPNPYWQDMEDYRRALEKRMELQATLIRSAIRVRLFKVLNRQRRQLTRFRDAIRARTGRRREALFESIDLEILLFALPVWLVNLTEAAATLPLRREMFDLVIIDESTQCDIASCWPMLQRAKRAVVVGDPKQLRHLSFLARDRQEILGNRYGLGPEAKARFDYRDKSILDVVDDTLQEQQQVVMLDEHFRSAPSIIAFSNREFYAGRLRIMQEHPAHDYHRALYLHQVPGTRTEDGSNAVEAQALLDELVRRVDAESNQPDHMAHSLGVLSPFRGQVELITRLLTEKVSTRAIKKHQIKVGTAYAFQGEERDVMLLSLAIDSTSHPSAFRFLERPDVFNVAITRARSEQWVYTSLPCGPEAGRRDSLIHRFLDHMEMDQRPTTDQGPADKFLKEVKTVLELKGYRVWAAYPVAGLEVDLVVESQGRCLGIDLVGYPGAYAGTFELERYRMFNRAGLPLMPLPYFAWIQDSAVCLQAISKRLSPRGLP